MNKKYVKIPKKDRREEKLQKANLIKKIIRGYPSLSLEEEIKILTHKRITKVYESKEFCEGLYDKEPCTIYRFIFKIKKLPQLYATIYFIAQDGTITTNKKGVYCVEAVETMAGVNYIYE